MATAALPFICASGLTRAQLAGRRCAVPGCKRWLRLFPHACPEVIGVTLGGRPLRACASHDLALVLEAVTVIPGTAR